jgi:hypothetical protein
MMPQGGAIGLLLGTRATDSAQKLSGCRLLGFQECKSILGAREKAIVCEGKAMRATNRS